MSKPHWLIAFLLITVAGIPVVISRFLSPTRPIPARILIVEGWIPHYAFQSAKEIFVNGSYDLLITTGGPITDPNFNNLADYALHVFKTLGINPQKIIPVAAPAVNIDRTWTSAVAVKDWLEKNNKKETSFNLISLGPHTRRSWLTFQKVFGKNYKVGVIAIPAVYSPRKWWATRSGYRVLTEEFLSYLGFKVLH